MSAAVVKKLEPEGDSKPVRIRITMTSLNVEALEKVSAEFKKSATDRQQKVRGPVRMPTKKLMLTTRKSPCGNGSNTFDRFEMRIHKRIIDIEAPPEIVKAMTSVALEPGVDVEVHFV